MKKQMTWHYILCGVLLWGSAFLYGYDGVSCIKHSAVTQSFPELLLGIFCLCFVVVTVMTAFKLIQKQKNGIRMLHAVYAVAALVCLTPLFTAFDAIQLLKAAAALAILAVNVICYRKLDGAFA